MPEEPKITMTEFKTVVEDFKAEQRRMSEYMQHLNQKVDGLSDKMEVEFRSVKEQIALLHVGQTEIKNELSQKVGRDEFAKLELRVAKIEAKVA